MKILLLIISTFFTVNILCCPDLSGHYRCVGTNPDGTTSQFPYVIEQQDHLFTLVGEDDSNTIIADGQPIDLEETLSIIASCYDNFLLMKISGSIIIGASFIPIDIKMETKFQKNNDTLIISKVSATSEDKIETICTETLK